MITQIKRIIHLVRSKIGGFDKQSLVLTVYKLRHQGTQLMTALSILCYILLTPLAMADSNNTMNLFIGSNYIADATIKRFEKLCNCHLAQNYFNDNEEMLAKIMAGSTGYNVIVATSYAVDELAKTNKIQKLDLTKLPNFKYMDPKFLNQSFDPNNQYSVPYAYNPVFIAYNIDKLKELGITPNTWAIVFEPKYLVKLKGHITMFNSIRHIFAAALLYLGKDPNSTNIDDLKKARDLINKASPYWAKFDSDSYYRGLLRGDIWVAQAYSIDIFKTLQDGVASKSPIHIGSILQKEGDMYELDNMVIPVTSPNIKYSYEFLNNALNPDSEYELSTKTGSSIMSIPALKRLDDKLLHTDWIYPRNMTKMYTFKAYDPKTRILANEMWTEIQMHCHY
jgi:spermidine/putrescine-binding protein